MMYFVVPSCTMKGCQHWRLGNNCVKNNLEISKQVKFVSKLHTSETCHVRRQVNEFRLGRMIEE